MKCPFCAEEISADAQVCPKCQTSLLGFGPLAKATEEARLDLNDFKAEVAKLDEKTPASVPQPNWELISLVPAAFAVFFTFGVSLAHHSPDTRMVILLCLLACCLSTAVVQAKMFPRIRAWALGLVSGVFASLAALSTHALLYVWADTALDKEITIENERKKLEILGESLRSWAPSEMTILLLPIGFAFIFQGAKQLTRVLSKTDPAIDGSAGHGIREWEIVTKLKEKLGEKLVDSFAAVFNFALGIVATGFAEVAGWR